MSNVFYNTLSNQLAIALYISPNGVVTLSMGVWPIEETKQLSLRQASELKSMTGNGMSMNRPTPEEITKLFTL